MFTGPVGTLWLCQNPEQSTEVNLIREINEVVKCQQTMVCHLSASATSEPHLVGIFPESSLLSSGEGHDWVWRQVMGDRVR